MQKSDFILKKVATEWDGGWFCENCWLIQHWKTNAYCYNNRKYCKNCAEKMINE